MNDLTTKLAEALELIAATDPIEAALDPQRAIRVAREAMTSYEQAQAEPVAWPSAAEIADEIDALLPMSLGDSAMASLEQWWRQMVERKLSKLAAPVAQAEFICRKCGLRQEGEKHAPDF